MRMKTSPDETNFGKWDLLVFILIQDSCKENFQILTKGRVNSISWEILCFLEDTNVKVIK